MTERRILPLRRPRFLRGASLERAVDAPVISTARLILRPHRISDADDWCRIQSSPEVLQYLQWPKRDRPSSRRHLEHRTRHTQLRQTDDFLALAIDLDGRLIGDVSLHLRTVSAATRSVEIAWLLDPRVLGHGYATEAAVAVLDLAFHTVEAKWVTALVQSDNTRSLALAERLSFRPIATHDDIMVLMTTADVRAEARDRATRWHGRIPVSRP